MDPKVKLLKDFYCGLPNDRAKIESCDYGFLYLKRLLSDGVVLEYGEMHLSGFLHRYKLSNINESKMDALLRAHVEKACNICLYFDDEANNIFAFNLDNNHRTDNTTLLPEMELSVRLLRKVLQAHGCEPLIIASGRGYHVWGRFAAPVENVKIYRFMLQSMAKALAELHEKGYDHTRIKVSFYPDPKSRNTVSLRLFGSVHTSTKVFSRILSQDHLLDETDSWDAFRSYLINNIISKKQFNRACDRMDKCFGPMEPLIKLE